VQPEAPTGFAVRVRPTPVQMDIELAVPLALAVSVGGFTTVMVAEIEAAQLP